jgi:hypothetical protein
LFYEGTKPHPVCNQIRFPIRKNLQRKNILLEPGKAIKIMDIPTAHRFNGKASRYLSHSCYTASVGAPPSSSPAFPPPFGLAVSNNKFTSLVPVGGESS